MLFGFIDSERFNITLTSLLVLGLVMPDQPILKKNVINDYRERTTEAAAVSLWNNNTVFTHKVLKEQKMKNIKN